MLASWMLYCVAIGVLLSAGAGAMERGLRSLGRPTRWAWAGATALTLAIPITARMVRATPPAPEAAPVLVASEAVGSMRALPTRMRSAAPRTLDLARWDAPLRLAWGGSSLAVVVALCAMGLALARRRRTWTAAEVDGVPVLVSADTGPAVVGLVRSRIVLPAWALRADDEARRLVLEHEQEHVRAGDPRLLAAALLAAALMPWNPAVWWQLRRLRLAVEVDCDARVLRRRGDVHAYGSVLLEMGRRASRTRLAAAAFADPVSTLERRIRIMTAPRARRPRLRAVGSGLVAAGLVIAACESPRPTQPSRSASQRSPEGGSPTVSPQFATASRVKSGDALQAFSRNSPIRQVPTIESEQVHRGTARVPAPKETLVKPGKREGRATGFYEADGMRAAAIVLGPRSPSFPDQPQLREAMRRFYTPELEAAGVFGSMEITYTVGDDGRARDIDVRSGTPELVPVGRSIVESLTFADGPSARPATLLVMVGKRSFSRNR